MAHIIIRQINKRFGTFSAVKNFDLTIKDGEFLSILGPSGCGKTTLLRSIAGFFPVNTGEIHIGGKLVEAPEKKIHIPPEDRNLGMVFQSYAVWPHMNVFDNVAYPLKIRKESSVIIREKVEKVLTMLNLQGSEKKFPAAMSGGQQQRIALGRALVMDPEALLLDEPLSNLDSKLRERMRFELKEIQQKLNLTILYVTHDQEEAMAVSDRIVLMDEGHIQQTDSPRDLYSLPNNLFCAQFMGRSNTINGSIIEQNKNTALVKTENHSVVPLGITASGEYQDGTEVTAIIRYEKVKIMDRPNSETVSGTIIVGTYFGSYFLYAIKTDFGEYVAHTDSYAFFQPGDFVHIKFSSAYVFSR